jgi:hypothetical protein
MQTLEIFLYIRKISFAVIIFSVTTCVFFGLLSIWEVLKGEVLFKTLATLGSIGFYALITVAVCKQRESSIKAINVESSVGAIAETLQPAPLAQSVVEQPKATPVQVI